jgi:hypothetical protein
VTSALRVTPPPWAASESVGAARRNPRTGEL